MMWTHDHKDVYCLSQHQLHDDFDLQGMVMLYGMRKYLPVHDTKSIRVFFFSLVRLVNQLVLYHPPYQYPASVKSNTCRSRSISHLIRYPDTAMAAALSPVWELSRTTNDLIGISTRFSSGSNDRQRPAPRIVSM